MVKNRILVLDDELVIQELLARTFNKDRYHVEAAEDPESALKRIEEEPFDLLITDLKMPKISGMDVLKEVKSASPRTEVIIMTGYPTIETAVEAVKMGAFDFICKPFDLEHMKTTVVKCLDKQKTEIVRMNIKQGQLIQNDKITAIRKFASEIAHDVNNSLLIISGNAQISLMEGAKEEEIRNSLKTIFEECQKAKSIVQKQLKFARSDKGAIEEME